MSLNGVRFNTYSMNMNC